MPEGVTISERIRKYYPEKRQIAVNVTVTFGNITAELAEKDASGIYQLVQSGSASAGGNISLNQTRAIQRNWRVTLSGPGQCNYAVAPVS